MENHLSYRPEVALVVLVSDATVTPNGGFAPYRTYELELADANVQLANVVDTTVGAVLNWAIRQDNAGGRTLTFDTAYKFSSSAPALPTGSDEEYLVSGVVLAVDGNGVATRILCSRTPALS